MVASPSSPLLRALTRTWYSPLGRPVKTWERVACGLVRAGPIRPGGCLERVGGRVDYRVQEAAMLHHVSVYLADSFGVFLCRFPRDCQSAVPG